MDDDIHLLEHLKTGLKSIVKYAQLAMTLQSMPHVPWDDAVKQCLTMKEGTSKVPWETCNEVETL